MLTGQGQTAALPSTGAVPQQPAQNLRERIEVLETQIQELYNLVSEMNSRFEAWARECNNRFDAAGV